MKLLTIFLLLGIAKSSSIQIYNPDSLKQTLGTESGFIESGMANFGHIEYGQSVLGQVYVPLANSKGCEPFQKVHFDENAQVSLF